MTPEDAIAEIKALSDPSKATQMQDYHKVDRLYLGTSNPDIDALCKTWRADLSLNDRLSLCHGLWASNIHEARIAAAKLLTQARIRPDDSGAWEMICSWLPDFDAWAIADHVCIAAQKRITADLSRLDTVEEWTTSPDMWTRRAALVATLPFARLNNLKPDEQEARERILTWAASYLADKDWFIQKAVAAWLRDLSKHDPARTEAFLAEFGDLMKTWARKEAGQYLQ
jgi:3-methyladenine DNA glycosylase AlkD